MAFKAGYAGNTWPGIVAGLISLGWEVERKKGCSKARESVEITPDVPIDGSGVGKGPEKAQWPPARLRAAYPPPFTAARAS